jgi:hypothetical protein
MWGFVELNKAFFRMIQIWNWKCFTFKTAARIVAIFVWFFLEVIPLGTVIP